MKLAVDLYHPHTGAHRRLVVDAETGDEAGLIASRMTPGFNVRAIGPAQDAGPPEKRLPGGVAARYEGDPPPEPIGVSPEPAAKRGRGRPRKPVA